MASILFVAYHFAPENTSGTHRSLHFARALIDAGHEVAVIAGPPPDAAHSDPELERVFPWTDRVHRVPTPPSIGSLYLALKSRRRRASPVAAPATPTAAATAAATRQGGVIGEIRRHLSIWDALPDLKRAWARPAARLGRTLGRRIGADAVFVSGPPWTGVMTGYRVARSLGVPLIADYRDPWTATSGATWGYDAAWARRRAEGWDANVLARSTLVCFNSPRLASIVAARNALGGRARVLLNGSDVPRQASVVGLPPTSPLRLRHFGSLYAGRNVTALVTALDDLIADGRLRPDEVELELIGDAEASVRRNTELLSSRVPIRFTPHLTFADASVRMSEPCVLVAMQTAMHQNLIPTKLYDYLCTGNPILVLSPEASASWDVADRYARCHRLDVEPSGANRAVVADLIASWRAGRLHQESAVEDTASLAKQPIGTEFVRLVEEVVGAPGPRARPEAIARELLAT